jgi:hypothetical protein
MVEHRAGLRAVAWAPLALSGPLPDAPSSLQSIGFEMGLLPGDADSGVAKKISHRPSASRTVGGGVDGTLFSDTTFDAVSGAKESCERCRRVKYGHFRDGGGVPDSPPVRESLPDGPYGPPCYRVAAPTWVVPVAGSSYGQVGRSPQQEVSS